MADSTADLNLLEKKVSELIAYCHSLETENERLKQAISDAEASRSELLAKNATASEKVRHQINRLQAICNSN